MEGMTLKQIRRQEFWHALDAYREALRTGTGIVSTSVRVHSAKGGVPKSWWPLVNKAFRETTREGR